MVTEVARTLKTSRWGTYPHLRMTGLDADCRVKGDGEFRILLVDDSRDDAFFVQQAMQRAGMAKSCVVVEDGEEAINYLRGDGVYADRRVYPFPTVILSDLKMPRMSGFQLLRWVREHPECSVIPTIIFSGSAIEADIKQAYQLGANAYMVKPTSPTELEELLRLTCKYWTTVERPPALHKC